ncbi:MAG: hypothetical protein II574_07790, partial [Ruminococcus sp.]|nr:hypothetical protein [Ruminococcus sp.]
MNIKLKKALMIIGSLIVLLLVGYYVFIVWVLGDVRYTNTVKTEYGDKFNVRFDDFRAQSTLEDPNSLFYLVIDGEISDNTIKGLKHTSSLTVYRIKDTAFFDDGNGFEIFDEDTDL